MSGTLEVKRCPKQSLLGALVIPLIAASSASAETTRAQYIAQADPICATSLKRQSTALQGFLPEVKRGDLKKAAGRFRHAVAFFSGGVERLATLEPPAADSPLISTWLQALRAEVPVLKKYAKALAGRDVRRLRRVTRRYLNAAAYSSGLVRDYGFQVCNSM
jgi:hypothetical protein